MSGVIAFADAIPDMGALSSLDLSGNNLGTEGAKGMIAQENSGTSVWPAAWSSQYKGMAGRAKSRGVPPPERPHRRCCRAPQNHRPDQLGSRRALGNPLGHAGERLEPPGALFARARGSFGHILPHILHARWRAGHHRVNFRNSDLVEV
jgi:hypothetical protein